MIIKRIGVGNASEAFILDSFSEGINIISSDDNNKGKTIAIQSMMYALGNEPAFPATFEPKQYVHFIEIEENGKEISICRNENTFVMLNDGRMMLFNSVSELKHYWTRNISKLPVIVKDSIQRIVDPVLFLQIFFVGQDSKDTSKIAGTNYYNKIDFINMLFDCIGAGILAKDEISIAEARRKLNELKDRKGVIQRNHQILSDSNQASSYLSVIADREAFRKKMQALEQLREKISQLKIQRDQTANRKLQWEKVKKELSSLNRTLDYGELRCMDCNSTNITFKASKRAKYSFDVSTVEMRKNILESIQSKVEAYNDELQEIQNDIEHAEQQLQALMHEDDVTLEALLLYKQDIVNAEEAEKELLQIEESIRAIQEAIETENASIAENKQKQEKFLRDVVQLMNSAYSEIDPNGNLQFDGLFSKKDQRFSGSEATVFYIVRLLALQKMMDHKYPIIIDSFRAEDLSTVKEEIVLKLMAETHNQIILTTTLKQQEMGKYDNDEMINHIDFQKHEPSHMLSSSYVEEFLKILSNFGIKP